jgi:ADP-heptose:LPS heptosyltransferase
MLICVKVAARGDLIMASAAFGWLRATRPSERMALVVGSTCLDVASHLPFFDELRVIDDRALFTGSPAARLRAVGELTRALRRPGPGGDRVSEVFLLHRDWRYGAVAAVAGVPTRRGFATPRGTRLLTHPYHVAPGEHDVHQYLGMVGAPPEVATGGDLMAGAWHWAPGEREAALSTAAGLGFRPDAGEWVALGFGGGQNVKTKTALKAWPVEYYRALARALVESGRRVVWLGDGHDAALLGAEFDGFSLAGKLTVPESAAVLEACSAAVANDTFLLHLAQAVGVPAVGIFGPTDPAHYGPVGRGSSHLWLGPARVPCSPCHDNGYFPPCVNAHRCMRDLPVDAVLDRVLATLGERAVPAR